MRSLTASHMPVCVVCPSVVPALQLFSEVFNLPAYQVYASSQPCNGKDCPAPTA